MARTAGRTCERLGCVAAGRWRAVTSRDDAPGHTASLRGHHDMALRAVRCGTGLVWLQVETILLHGTAEMKKAVAKIVKGHVVRLATHQYGAVRAPPPVHARLCTRVTRSLLPLLSSRPPHLCAAVFVGRLLVSGGDGDGIQQGLELRRRLAAVSGVFREGVPAVSGAFR